MQVVAHNLASQFTNRQLNMTTSKKAKSAEKLSSGYRINRSADDAAGLQISEKMRSQIRGLNQASRNIQDGVSLCQVADGALNETTEVLQRIRELSVQAANDTNQQTDRAAIQEEINQLAEEVDRIATTTNFNSEIYPLNAKKTSSPYVYTDGNTVYELKEVASMHTVRNPYPERNAGVGALGRSQPVVSNGKNYYIGNIVTVEGIALESDSGMIIKRNRDFGWVSKTDNMIESAVRLNKTSNLKLSDLQVDNNEYVYFMSMTGQKVYLAIDKLTGELFASRSQNLSDYSYLKRSSSATNLQIQSGASEGQTIGIDLIDATCSGIGLIVPIDVSSNEKAGQTITNVDEAIKQASAYRSQFGAQQNRLECAKSVDDNAAENTQYAESRIRDTDMAEEMVEYSKSNILEQVGQSMLAQANQSTQGILSLLS